MEGVRNKLNSTHGASILMALLFLLVCMMVAASVLMAAASNAGKLRSNREEHQKYLTLSSALRLVCGEIEGSSYVGKYSYQYTPAVDDEENNIHINAIHTYSQADGEYNCGLGKALPLQNNLEYLFGQKLRADAVASVKAPDICNVTLLSAAFTEECTLTVKAEGFENVTIKFQMRESDGLINLVAELKESDHTYTMKAELQPVKPLNEVFVLSGTEETNKTEEVKWQLNWITKGEVT